MLKSRRCPLVDGERGAGWTGGALGMGSPPSSPQVSADGKFYWDGTKWVPMQQPGPVQAVAPQSHRGRNLALGCLGAIVIVVVIALAAGGGSKKPALNWAVEGRSIKTSTVGGTDAVQVT